MLSFKSKKMTFPLGLCVVYALIMPALAQAELGGSGSSAARDAAEQRATIERKLEKKRLLKETEAKKAAEASKAQPAELQQPAEEKKEELAPEKTQ